MLGIALVVEGEVYLYEAARLDGMLEVMPVSTNFSADKAIAGCQKQYGRTEHARELRRQWWRRRAENK